MNEENKIGYYAIIPANVRYDNELTEKARLLYGEITCLSNKEGYCFALNNYFAKLYKCSTRAIQNSISKLEQKGYVTRQRSEKDERNLIVRITETGMNLREEAVKIPEQMGKCVNLSPEESMNLYQILYKLLGSFSA